MSLRQDVNYFLLLTSILIFPTFHPPIGNAFAFGHQHTYVPTYLQLAKRRCERNRKNEITSCQLTLGTDEHVTGGGVEGEGEEGAHVYRTISLSLSYTLKHAVSHTFSLSLSLPNAQPGKQYRQCDQMLGKNNPIFPEITQKERITTAFR